jgi:hypothetical protein
MDCLGGIVFGAGENFNDYLRELDFQPRSSIPK